MTNASSSDNISNADDFRLPRRANFRNTGFTLIEVIVGGMVFLFIATALATVFQVGMVVDQDEQSHNEIISAIIVGRRRLLEGAPQGSNVGDKGLLEAQTATLTATIEDPLEEDMGPDGDPLPVLEYRSGNERYRLWVASGTLFRHCVAPSILPREAIIGYSATNLKVTTLGGQVPFDDSHLPNFINLSLLVYEDRNSNNLPDLEEPAIPMQLSAVLRNAVVVPSHEYE